jgi:hypothetical protein
LKSSSKKAHQRKADDLAKKLASLAGMTRPDLVVAWTELTGTPPAFRVRRDFLALCVAYHLQVQAYGGLSLTARQRLKTLSEDLKAGRLLQGIGASSTRPGTRLIRFWRGETHEVIVLDNGFGYRGRTYRSLSEIARLVTGTHWSGPTFFGLRGRPGISKN